jgi:hypothetical protein
MRVQFKTEGGLAYFPGRSTPLTIDSDALSAEDARALRQLVESVDFFALPASLGTQSRGAADMRQYTITVEDAGRHHTVRVTEPVSHPDLQKLLTYLQTQRRTAQ